MEEPEIQNITTKRINKVMFYFIILASMGFYNIAFLPVEIRKAINLLASAIIIILIIFHGVYGNENPVKKNFKVFIWLFLFSVFLSMFGAYYFHNQSFAISLYAQRNMYFFLFYFALFYIRPTIIELKRIIFILGAIYCFLYISQTLIYPSEIINSKMFFDRGTLRIFMPGFSYVFMAYFISLQEFFKSKKNGYLIFILVALIVMILLGTRQVIGPVILLTLFYILVSKQVKSKFAIYFIISLCAIPVFMIFKDIIIAMIEETSKNSEGITENVRYRAAVFFLKDFFSTKLSYIIGNGAPGADSPLSKKIEYYQTVLRFFQSDIGIIGEYTKYGLIFAVTELIVLGKMLFMKVSSDMIIFSKFFALATIMTIVLGAGGFSSSSEIVVICIIFYMVDIDRHMNTSQKTVEINKEAAA